MFGCFSLWLQSKGVESVRLVVVLVSRCFTVHPRSNISVTVFAHFQMFAYVQCWKTFGVILPVLLKCCVYSVCILIAYIYLSSEFFSHLEFLRSVRLLQFIGRLLWMLSLTTCVVASCVASCASVSVKIFDATCLSFLFCFSLCGYKMWLGL